MTKRDLQSNRPVEKSMTAKEVAEKFNLAQQTVRKRAAKLGIQRIGRDWHFSEKEVEAIISYDSTPGPKKVLQEEKTLA